MKRLVTILLLLPALALAQGFDIYLFDLEKGDTLVKRLPTGQVTTASPLSPRTASPCYSALTARTSKPISFFTG